MPHALVLAGPDGWHMEDLERGAGAGSGPARLSRTGSVSDDDLDALYRGASAFAYPSSYEGFGLPVLEAMARGVPTVTSDASGARGGRRRGRRCSWMPDDVAGARRRARARAHRRGAARRTSAPAAARAAAVLVGRHRACYPRGLPPGHRSDARMKVTLISTVLNCVDRAAPFLASLAAQTRAPGRGRDRGRRAPPTAPPAPSARTTRVTVIEAPGANISAGRNIALAHATHEVIAATDADCELDPGWLAAHRGARSRTAPTSPPGSTNRSADGFFQACVAALNLPDGRRPRSTRRGSCRARGPSPSGATPIDAGGRLPRVARHRRGHVGEPPLARAGAWTSGSRRTPSCDGRCDPTSRSTWTQYFRYARGDAIAGMLPRAPRPAVRRVRRASSPRSSSGRTWPKLLAAAGAVAYARTPVRRAWPGSPTPPTGPRRRCRSRPAGARPTREDGRLHGGSVRRLRGSESSVVVVEPAAGLRPEVGPRPPSVAEARRRVARVAELLEQHLADAAASCRAR